MNGFTSNGNGPPNSTSNGMAYNGRGLSARAQEPSVPDVPGILVEDQQADALRRMVARICGLSHSRFPGAQPVSFTKASLDLLKKEDFWVCEKSDGQRVLMLIAFNKFQGQQEVYLIDRKNNYRQQHMSLFFPFHEVPPSREAVKQLEMPLIGDNPTWGVRKDTLLDGELVWDQDKQGRKKLRLLLFDCIVLDGEKMASRSLSKRYGRLRDRLYPPFNKFMRHNPAAARDAPFEIRIKDMDLAYGIGSVLTTRIPNLEHGNDGLIFTCISSGYVSGTDPNIIKWKPPSENTIDFKLRLRFPSNYAVDPRGNVPDFKSKPFFQLDEFLGGHNRSGTGEDRYRYFDWLHVEDEEWEKMKESGVQFDDRIVECYWDLHGGLSSSSSTVAGDQHMDSSRPPAWRIHRIRDDKEDGNHHSIVRKILQSIEEGVEEDELLAEESTIRAAWKSPERETLRTQREAGVAVGPARKMGPGAPMKGAPPTWFYRR